MQDALRHTAPSFPTGSMVVQHRGGNPTKMLQRPIDTRDGLVSVTARAWGLATPKVRFS